MTQRNDYDDPRSPAVAVGKPKAGPLSPGWVDARPQPTAVSRWDGAPLERVAGDIVRGVAEPPAVAAPNPVWTPAESVSEVGTPIHRAAATLVRAAPLVVLLFPATLALVWLLEVSGWWILPMWAGLGIAAYLAIVLMDLQHNSPSATERHRINKAAQVETLKAKQAHELRRAIVESYLNHLNGGRD